MLRKVLDADPEGVIILHAGADRDWGLDSDRVVFLDTLPHHELLALYREAAVVLDSYYAGGCTTTREAFEMGAVVVTLPAKYLGGRWTLAFYQILGIKEAIATDEADYARRTGLFRASMRRDGFISADAGYGGGELTTPLLQFDGERLELNCEGSAGGWLQVEVRDAEDRPIPGYELAAAEGLRGNGLAKVASWRGGTNLAALAGRPVRLRFAMRDMKLYAFQFAGAAV